MKLKKILALSLLALSFMFLIAAPAAEAAKTEEAVVILSAPATRYFEDQPGSGTYQFAVLPANGTWYHGYLSHVGGGRYAGTLWRIDLPYPSPY